MGFFTQSAVAAPVAPVGVTCQGTPAGQTTVRWGGPVKTCATDEACTPASCPEPPPGYGNEICILREGARACPFGETFTFYAQIVDQSFCDCSCDAADIGCSATTTIYGTQGCGGAEATFTHDGQCQSIPSLTANSIQLTVAPTGMCEALPPQVGGTLGQSEPFTLCCVARD